MANRTAFAYEQEDGSISYGITFAEYSFEELLDYIELRTVLYDVELTKKATSIEDYFMKTRYQNENTKWRILYSLTGNAICQANSMKGFLIQ